MISVGSEARRERLRSPPPPPPSLTAFKQQEFKCLTQQRSVVLKAPAIPGNKADPRFISGNLPGHRTHCWQLIKQEQSSTSGGGGCHPAGLHVPSQTKHNRRRQEVPRSGRSGAPKNQKQTKACFSARSPGGDGRGPESGRTGQEGGGSCRYMRANRRKVIFRIRRMMLNSRFRNLMIAVTRTQILEGWSL